MKNSFQAVIERLVSAAGFGSEKELGEALGFKQAVFAMRKKRDSLPRLQIDNFIAAQGLHPEWIYEGHGPVFAGSDFSKKVALQADIHARLGPFGLNDQQERYMAKLLLALELGEPLKLKELLEKSEQLTPQEVAVIKGLRSAPAPLAEAVKLLAEFATQMSGPKEKSMKL